MKTKQNNNNIVTVTIDYYEPYLPKRCRKVRYERKREQVNISIKAISESEAPVAFRLSDYSHTSDGQTVVRCYKGKLYKRLTQDNIVCHGGLDDVLPSELAYTLRPCNLSYLPEERTREACLKEYRKNARRYIAIDGKVWQQCGEPRYVVVTFGQGHNHGGTGLFVEEWYNSNIPNRNYFSALDGEQAVAYANHVAERRGDTKDVGRFGQMIEVLMPECVTIKPMQQHGEGNKLLNSLTAITDGANSAFEAGLLVISHAASKMA